MKTDNLLALLTLLCYCEAQPDRETELRSLLEAALDKHLPDAGVRRERRQVQSAEPGAVMYLPLGGNSNVRSCYICQPSHGTILTFVLSAGVQQQQTLRPSVLLRE